MRFVSLSTSAFVIFFAALVAGLFVPSVVHAQTQLSGVTCSTVNGVYVCTQQGTGGSVCVTDVSSGTQTCENLTSGSTSSGTSSSLGTGLGSTTQPSQTAATLGWLSQLTHWLASVVVQLFDAVVAFFRDLVTYAIAVVLSMVSSAISLIGVPSWMANSSLQTMWAPVMSSLGFFLANLQIPAVFALIGAGYLFRLLRKFLTLFQW